MRVQDCWRVTPLSVGYQGCDAVPGHSAGAGADSRHHLSLRFLLRDEVRPVLSIIQSVSQSGCLD